MGQINSYIGKYIWYNYNLGLWGILTFPLLIEKKVIYVIARLLSYVHDSCQTLVIKILTTLWHIHIFVYFQHHKRLNLAFLPALKKHLVLLDCINRAARSISRGIFARYLSCDLQLRFKIDVPSNTGMVAFYHLPVKGRWRWTYPPSLH